MRSSRIPRCCPQAPSRRPPIRSPVIQRHVQRLRTGPTPPSLSQASLTVAGVSPPSPNHHSPHVRTSRECSRTWCCCAAESVKVEISIPLIEDLDLDAAADKQELRKQLCPYAAVGECRYGINCAYLHGDVCDMCGLQVLHPTDNSQRSQHTKVSMTASLRRRVPCFPPCCTCLNCIKVEAIDYFSRRVFYRLLCRLIQ